MPKFMSTITIPGGLTLGPSIHIADGMALQHYWPIESDAAEKVLFVGIVTSSLEDFDDGKTLVLESPSPDAPILRALFRGQMQALRDVMIVDSLDTDKRIDALKLIGTRECWSQGPGRAHPGYVFMRVWADTRLTTVNLSEPHGAGFRSLLEEIPVVSGSESPLAVGSTLICCAYPCRTDKRATSYNGELYTRVRRRSLLIF
ncbi:hypothetical protein C8R46DRAFT_1035123 [Mycena filopes]|nr:hypothetical protein C8R46DRAFT_1035123 [Mycena filopes]